MICSMLSSSSSDWNSRNSLRLLGCRIVREVPWNWVTESPRLCQDFKPSNINVRVSTSFASCNQQLLARKFTPRSRLLPRAAFPGSSSQDALCRRSPFISSFELGFPQEPKARCVYIWFQLGPFYAVEWQWCYPQHMLWATALCPFPLRFLRFASSRWDTCALLLQEEMWKLYVSTHGVS